jgi:hypothetical protein
LQKADIARASGMCPGYPRNCCKNQAVAGRVYCADCQTKSDARNRKPERISSVIRSKEKAVETSKGICVSRPISSSLAVTSFHYLLSPRAITLLQNPAGIIYCDCEGKDNKQSGEDTYMWCFLDSESDQMLFLYRAAHGWKLTLDALDTPVFHTESQTKQIVQDFIGKKTIAYFASSNSIDKNRFNSWIGPNSFRWLNIGYDVFFKICGTDGLVQTPTLTQETLHKYLYQTGGVAVQKPHSYMELEPSTGTASKCRNDVRMLFNISMAVYYNLE